jgi:tripartite-type tricarboxylate transporter receptor subunit TctC
LGNRSRSKTLEAPAGPSEQAASSAQSPDGYTLLIYHVGLSTAATLYRKLPYDTKSAFAPIGLVTAAPMTIIGRPDLEPNTLKELIAYLKSRSTKLTFGQRRNRFSFTSLRNAVHV